MVPLVAGVPKAYGATFPSGLQTGFVLNPGSSNANKTAATLPNNINWDNIFKPTLTLGSQVTPTFVPSPPYTTPGGQQSSGIFAGTFYYDDGDPNQCSGASQDPTANQTSQTINSNPWVLAPANVQDKANLCSAAYAVEALTDSTGARHYILYGYFTRATGNGSVSIDTVFQSPGAGRCGDLMLDMQFPEKTDQLLDWQPAAGNCTNPNGPGAWVPTGRTVDYVAATGVRTEGYRVANQQQDTFMEFGIDLTSAGLFGDSQCSAFALSQTLTRTGSASALSSASVSDFLGTSSEPLEISNCGTLSVTKETPAGPTNGTFGFTVTNQTADGVVIPPGQTSIADTLQSGETKTYTDVLSSSLLHLSETTIPPPWEKQSAVCSYKDAVGVTHTTDVTDPATPFTLLGDGRTDCVITNNAALVTIKKLTLPDFSDQKFAFDVGGHTALLGNDESATFAVPSGTPVTMTETAVPGWEAPSITCGAAKSQPDPQSVTVTPVFGQNITCTFTNTQNATVTIEKRVPTADAGDTFSFTTDLGTSPFTLTPSNPVAGGWVNAETTFAVAPGDYSVAEAVPTGFTLADLFCVDSAYGTETPPFPTPDAQITAHPGSVITCTFTDTKLGTLIVDKATEPVVEFDQDFPFNVTGPAGFTASTFNLNTIGADFAQLFTILPSGDYTIAETQLPGWTSTGVTCINRATGQTVFTGVPPVIDGKSTLTVPVTSGSLITCTYTNEAAPAKLTLQKTVTGVGPDLPWSFHVSLSPGTSASPGPATLSGTGPHTASHSWTQLIPGQTYVVDEATESGWNMGDLACSDQNGPVTNEGPAGQTFTFTAKVGQELACSMTNAGLPSAINLTKTTAGVDGTETWSFPLRISPVPAGETQTKTAAGTGLDTVPISWGNLAPGQRYDITEPGLPAYVTQHLTDCDGATKVPGGFSFVAPLDATVTCAFTDLVAPVEATLTKTSDVPGSFTFELANLDTDALPVVIPVTTSGGTGRSAPVHLTAGVRYSLKEAPQAGFLEGAIACTVTPAAGPPFSIPDITDFTVPAGASVACRAHNRSTHELSLQKDWVNAAAGDTAGLSINGAVTAPGFAVSTATGTAGTQQDTTHQATAIIASGDQVTVTETLPAAGQPANAGTYTTLVECVTAAGVVVPVTTVGDDHRDATFTMPVAAVTCVFTNTRTTHRLTLEKFWGNGAAGDTATLSINGATAPPGSVTATVPASGIGTAAEVATDDTIVAGATVTVTETRPAANTGTYITTLECVTETTTITVALTNGNRTGTFTLPAGAAACAFTNSRVHPARVTTRPSPASGAVGTAFHDTATVTGSAGIDPAGTVSFKVFGPDNAACAGAPAFALNVPLSADGTARTSTAFIPTVAGTYRWVAIFHSANPNLASAIEGCQGEKIEVTRRAHPSPPPPFVPVTG